MTPKEKYGPSSCRGLASLEYIILTILLTAAVIGAFVHFELHISRMFQNATESLQLATASFDQGKGGGSGSGGGGAIENEAPPIPDQDGTGRAP